MYQRFDADYSIHDPINVPFIDTVLTAWQCPSDPKPDKWMIEHESRPGTVLAEHPTANDIGFFGTDDLHGYENAAGTPPVLSSGQCTSDSVFHHNSKVRISDIVDGTTNTFFVR